MSNTQPIEIVSESTSLGQMERAQIDMQIATAKRYPRELSLVKQRILSFATLDEETAESCFYTLPARKGGDGKPLQGPSVRLAEIALSEYTNIKAAARIIEDDGKIITAQGVVYDVEKNVSISLEVKRRVTYKNGDRYSDDMVITTSNAANAIALRNAIFKVIPMALVKPAYDAAKKLAVGNIKSLVERRATAIAFFAKLGVSKEQVCKTLGVRSVDDIQLDHYEILLGFRTSIKEGDATIDEIFKAEKPAANPDIKTQNPFADIPEPEPKPNPVVETVEETVAADAVFNEKHECESMMKDIRGMLADENSNMTKFGPLCRKVGLLADGEQLIDLKHDRLKAIHDNRLAILKGEYTA